MLAGTEKAAATDHPKSRGPIADTGWATATGKTKRSNVAVGAIAACGETIPTNKTTKPTSAIDTTAATLCVDAAVPRAMNPIPTMKSDA